MIDRAEIKYQAKLDMRGKKPSVFLVALAFLALTYLMDTLANRLMYPGLSINELLLRYDTIDAEWIETYYLNNQPGPIAELLNIAIGIMSIVISYGFSYYCMRIGRGLAANAGDLFEGFSLFFKVILLEIVKSIFITLWSMLFVIPGIVAAYRYSMATYILMDDPELGVMDCIRESKRITMGYKGQLFVLNLSFLGWIILGIIPFVMIYTAPYMEVTKTKYYNILSGRYSFEGETADGGETGGNEYREPWDR